MSIDKEFSHFFAGSAMSPAVTIPYSCYSLELTHMAHIELAIRKGVKNVCFFRMPRGEAEAAVRIVLETNNDIETIRLCQQMAQLTTIRLLDCATQNLKFIDIGGVFLSNVTASRINSFLRARDIELKFGVQDNEKTARVMCKNEFIRDRVTKLDFCLLSHGRAAVENIEQYKNIEWVVVHHADFDFDHFKNIKLENLTTVEILHHLISQQVAQVLPKMVSLKSLHLVISLATFDGYSGVNACLAETISLYTDRVQTYKAKHALLENNTTCKYLKLFNIPLRLLSARNRVSSVFFKHTAAQDEKLNSTDDAGLRSWIKRLRTVVIKGTELSQESRIFVLCNVHFEADLTIEWVHAHYPRNAMVDVNRLAWRAKGKRELVPDKGMYDQYTKLFLGIKKIISKQHDAFHLLAMARKKNVGKGIGVLNKDVFNVICNFLYSSLINELIKTKGATWKSYKSFSQSARDREEKKNREIKK